MQGGVAAGVGGEEGVVGRCGAGGGDGEGAGCCCCCWGVRGRGGGEEGQG